MKHSIHPCSSQEDAPYLILSSGLGGHSSFWLPQIDTLCQHFHVLTYDQEGCHQNSSLLPANYQMFNMAEQVLLLLKQLNIREFHFIGHALGGMIGIELAKLLQAEPLHMLSLTVINAWNVLDPHTHKCFDARIALLTTAGSEAYVRAQALFLYPPAWISCHHKQINNAENQQLKDFPPINNVLARLNALMQFQLQPLHIEALQNIPLHMVANKDDFLVPVQKSHDLFMQLGHGQLSILTTGAHASTVTEPELLNHTLTQFFYNNRIL